MDAQIPRAIDDYHQLVRDEKALVEETADAFFNKMRDRKLTFGGRIFCPFVRPNFVTAMQYTQIQGVCRAIFAAIEKVEEHLGEALWDMVDLTEDERELARIDPGYKRSSPTSRIDSFLTPSSYQFVELNAESPAGIGYNDCLAEVFLELPIMKKFQERYSLQPLPRPREDARDAHLLLPRGGRHQAEPHHRDRRLRRRADAQRASPVPRVLRRRAAIRRSCATRSTSRSRAARCVSTTRRSTSSTSGCW